MLGSLEHATRRSRTNLRSKRRLMIVAVMTRLVGLILFATATAIAPAHLQAQAGPTLAASTADASAFQDAPEFGAAASPAATADGATLLRHRFDPAEEQTDEDDAARAPHGTLCVTAQRADIDAADDRPSRAVDVYTSGARAPPLA